MLQSAVKYVSDNHDSDAVLISSARSMNCAVSRSGNDLSDEKIWGWYFAYVIQFENDIKPMKDLDHPGCVINRSYT